ncbi:hypothetical protein LBW46_12640 [Ralstonia solanacearum]|uniref:hypothetical protein n=1 Tax=Ralstonia solanacearum TaxID=305 RepID=UPI0023060556|nr:hypothetical protein [Ralstonia solanacearum]MDB0551896.1 hypothetical protein [Ralstonia solanacearum]
MPISACKSSGSTPIIINGDTQISSSPKAPGKQSIKDPRLETNPLLSNLRRRATSGAHPKTNGALRTKAAPFLTVPKSLDAYAIDSSIPYQFKPSKIAIIGGGLTASSYTHLNDPLKNQWLTEAGLRAPNSHLSAPNNPESLISRGFGKYA